MKKYSKDMRDWLNGLRFADSGSVISHATIMPDKESAKGVDHYSFLRIRDCHRQIELNFSCNNTIASVTRRRKKLDILRKHLDNIETGLDKLEEELQ